MVVEDESEEPVDDEAELDDVSLVDDEEVVVELDEVDDEDDDELPERLSVL